MGLNVIELKEQASRCSVLYVEDDDLIREETSKFLLRFFPAIDTAIDGQAGLAKYQAKEYDVVITDINMPNMNGIEMITAIKKIKEDQIIVVTSAYNDSENLLHLINLNVTRFVLKPFNNKQFLTTIYNMIKDINIKKDLHALEKKIVQDAKLSQHIVDILEIGIVVFTNYEVSMVNRAFLHIYDFEDIETLKLEMPEIGALFEIFWEWTQLYSNKELVEKLSEKPHHEAQVKITTNGKLKEYLITLSHLQETNQHVITFTDVTTMFEALSTNEHTALPNKKVFLEELERIAHTHEKFEILLVKLKSYSNILKWYGRKETFAIERECGQILLESIKEFAPHASVASFDTNEYIIMDTTISEELIKTLEQRQFSHNQKVTLEQRSAQTDFQIKIRTKKLECLQCNSLDESEVYIINEFDNFAKELR